jgi:hypothetical protein
MKNLLFFLFLFSITLQAQIDTAPIDKKYSKQIDQLAKSKKNKSFF